MREVTLSDLQDYFFRYGWCSDPESGLYYCLSMEGFPYKLKVEFNETFLSFEAVFEVLYTNKYDYLYEVANEFRHFSSGCAN